MHTNSIKDFNKLQLQILQLSQGTSFSELLKLILESTIIAERDIFLEKIENIDNKWNGYYQRYFKAIHGKLEINVARDRLGIFKPLILEISKVEHEKYHQLIVELYSKWLTHSDIQKMMKSIYWCEISSGQISMISNKVLDDLKIWQNRSLKDEYIALFIDTTYVKVKRDWSYSAEWFTILLWWKYDGSREILGIYSTPTESATARKNILIDIKNRWVIKPILIASDGLTWFSDAVSSVYPEALHQRCIVHLKRNILSIIKRKHKTEVMDDLRDIFDPHTEINKTSRLLKLNIFIKKRWTIYPALEKIFTTEKNELYFAFLSLPRQLWSMLYTTNRIERFNKAIKKKIKIRNWLPCISAVKKLIFYTVLEYQSGVYKCKISQVAVCRAELYEIRTSRYWESPWI